MKHVGTRKRQWFLKVELVILVCLACFWAFKSGDVDIDGVKAGVRSANTLATTQADPLAGDISLDLVVKMAKGGDADAQNNLGLMYDNGQGVPQDYTEAVKWYTKAAEQGDADAQNNLGLMYDNGQGVPQDYTEAVKWYTKAAEQGDADAQCKWFSIAATDGNENAIENKSMLQEKLTSYQIAEAQRLAKEFKPRVAKTLE